MPFANESWTRLLLGEGVSRDFIALLQTLPWELYVLLVIAIVLSITVHEAGHAWMADRLGDTAPRAAGRVTLNPLAHLDPLGTLLLFVTTLFGYPLGWGKPVQTDPKTYNVEPRKGMALVGMAGPLGNLLLAVALAPIARWLLAGNITGPVSIFAFFLILITMLVNLSVFTFNLLPIHPLDGAHLLTWLLPKKAAVAYVDFMQKAGVYVLLLLTVTGVLPQIVGPVVAWLFRWLIGV